MNLSVRGWRRRQLLRWLRGLLILVFALPLAAYFGLQAGLDLLGPVRVRGQRVPRSEAGLAGLRASVRAWQDAPLQIYAGPYLMRYTRRELGATLPVEPLIQRLRSLGRTGAPSADLAALWSSHSGGIDLGLPARIDPGQLAARLSELRRHLERLPVPGMVLADGSELPGIPGVTIDFGSSLEHIERALRSDTIEVKLSARTVSPPAAVRYGSELAGRFTTRMVAFETRYRTAGAAAGRAHNIELAVARLDGSVIPPGGELSFNGVVGERSYARGFAGAKEIAARRIVDGVGGGVCQVAATLHAAAFLAGFDLPEYRPHSRPARYIDLGLDTMVSWPAQDMRIANSYPFPVRIRAQAQNGTLTIGLEGSGKPHLVEWNTQILSRVKPGLQQVLDETLAAGQRDELQEPIDGLTVRRVRTVYFPTGPRREEAVLRYPPTDRIVAIGSANQPSLAATARAPGLEYADF